MNGNVREGRGQGRGRDDGGRPPQGTNGLAVAAGELGVNALLGSVFLIGGLLGLVGLGLGVAALHRARRTGAGRLRATAGVLTSLLAIAVSVLVAALALWYAHRTQGCFRLDHVHPGPPRPGYGSPSS
ncbi:hypothetical protein GCM10009665_04860 [Kitasatospora nipponensis]|uniref:DUF4190 domain-containing protein n=1 Tax=Kitasatospora nipponensis TaxID=258049 RepID=A0ABN1VPW6_9ACTN